MNSISVLLSTACAAHLPYHLDRTRKTEPMNAMAIVSPIHETIQIKDVPPEFKSKFKASSLDKELAKLRKKGRKVLGFERGGKGWLIKVMT